VITNCKHSSLKSPVAEGRGKRRLFLSPTNAYRSVILECEDYFSKVSINAKALGRGGIGRVPLERLDCLPLLSAYAI